ncbi:MAG: AAA family ATPase [Devosiaceae bacterium]|nr:AAA family ATPase [Devosiaceae bacterium MH13]
MAPPAQTASIIFLHGPSSSGKSTIARALQATTEAPFWHISIDHLRDAGVLPSERYRRKEFDWSADRPRFFEGYHRSLAAYTSAGNNLIVEHILDTPGWAEALHALFAPFDVLFVGVECSLERLVARETHRGDRPAGSAEADFHAVHRDRWYDLTVNGEEDVAANVERILVAWRSGFRSSEFAKASALEA